MDDMAKRILDQLPMMFLQAGLQLIAQGQWPLGLALIAAAGSSAIISGYVDGETQRAREEAGRNAHGGVFGEYGHAAREFASGGAFTNQIVNFPTYFAHGGGLGLMGEAGPEAIMPLARLPNGDLGVQTAGGGANVVVNIINNSGAEVRQEETEAEGGGRQIDIVIGEMVNRHISSGKADRAMGRYGLRAAGV
jgi:phage-related minor tail protein